MFEVFSLILESVCVLPQLLLLRQTTVPTVIDSFYLLALGSYRAFYILNWVWREFDDDDIQKPDPISVTFGIIQTLLYLDFAWVYWTRQRVKLRSGGIVDAEDLRRGWLLDRLLGRVPVEPDEDEEAGAALDGDGDGTPQSARPLAGRSGGRWGARGISVSADDSVLGAEGFGVDAAAHPDAKMRDPEELARALDEDDDEDEDETRGRDPTGSKGAMSPSIATKAGVSSGDEWRK
jgi:ER lumen protein retaining receptor